MNIQTSDFEPFHDWVLIRPRKVAEYKVMSIIVPNVSQSAPGQADVIAVGPLSKIAVGDVILYNRAAGVEIRDEEEEYLCVRDLPDLLYGKIKS